MIEDYEKAKKLGEREVRRAASEGRYPYLQALDSYLDGQPPLAEEKVGITEIPTSMVVGTKTVGRQNAFAANFMPLLDEKSEFAMKWSNLYEAQISEGIRDPVRVYEYMKRFYALEGNKRISVLRYVDAPLVLADVTRVLPPRNGERDTELYYEFVEFYRAVPLYEITFSQPGSYRRLAARLGHDLSHPWPDEDVRNLRSAYSYFSGYLRERRADLLRRASDLAGRRLSLPEHQNNGSGPTPADALLVYLDFYPLSSILTESRELILSRIDRIRKEILTEANEKKLSLVDEPEQVTDTSGGVASGLFGVLRRPAGYTAEHPLGIAFIYDKNPEQSARVYGHELGRNALADRLEGRVRTLRYDGCADDAKVRNAIDDAVAQGAEMVFTTSPAQMEETLRAAIHYPDVRFLNCSVNLPRNAVRTYAGRMYEAKFLMGALAASLTDGHRLGYVADYPIYGTPAEINAFAIGAQLVDPRAEVFLYWSSDAAYDWKEEMTKEHIAVLSGPDLIRPDAPSREYGIYRETQDGTVTNLAAPVCDWGRYYELIVRSVLEGGWSAKGLVKNDQGLSYWLGMSAGVIDVILSEKLSYVSRKMIGLFRGGILSGAISPFDGELRSQSGLVKDADAPRLTNWEIITMDWLNENVRGYIPELKELRTSAKDTVRANGVLEDPV